jgi:hypothetical protein
MKSFNLELRDISCGTINSWIGSLYADLKLLDQEMNHNVEFQI